MIIEARNIVVRYGQTAAVDQVSFAVAEREIVAIIGPNGCGKSSLLGAIAGRIRPAEGAIIARGERLDQIPPRRRAQVIGLLNQRNTAPGDITVKDLVSYGRHPHLSWHESLTAKDSEIVDWALEHTQLVRFADRTLSQLSGGEAQRAWIAMALAQQSKVLLLDEPTTYLDIAHQHDVLELVSTLGERLGVTVLMVLHDLNQAATFSSRVLAMSSGHLVGDGTPRDVLTPDLIRTVYGMEAEVTQPDAASPVRIHLTRTTPKLTELSKDPA